MKIDKAIELVKDKLPEKRFKHSLRVAETAVKLAEIYDGDKDKANLAGVLHDYCKYDDLSTMYQIVRQHDLDSELLSYGGEILHGPVCAAIMQSEFGIEDEEVLLQSRITQLVEKKWLKLKNLYSLLIILNQEKTPGVEEIRDMAYNQGSLDKTIYEISKRTVLFLISKDITVYGTTISCLNYYNYSDQRIKDD